MESKINLYFSDIFNVSKDVLNEYGAFNISLINDLPLFIDPFLLFNSDKEEYQLLHNEIIKYLIFLKDKVNQHKIVNRSMLQSWFLFPEVKQTWLGFCEKGNSGSGLGMDFANALSDALGRIFTDFGNEKITQSSHLEKACLIKDGVGKDNISDFTANLIKYYLLDYTQTFAQKYLSIDYCKILRVDKVKFNYSTESWETCNFYLPYFIDDYVLLTPTDILRREDTWINRSDMLDSFENIPPAIPNEVLRFQVNNYFYSQLSKKPKKKERKKAAWSTILHYPILLDYFVKYKEDNGEKAVSVSENEVMEVRTIFHEQLSKLVDMLVAYTPFYDKKPDTYEDAKDRVMYLKQVIENNDGYKVFYIDGKPIKRESDLHVMYRLACYGSINDVNSEVNNGRGPVDYKISKGSKDSTLVEFKLASNSKLKRNLQKQVEIYKQANNTKKSIKAIMFFTDDEQNKVIKILNELQLNDNDDIILIDARNNKSSASIA